MKNILTFLAFTISIFLFIINSAAQAPNTWAQKNDLGYTAPNGPTARYMAVGFSIGTKGYIGTGYNNGTFKNDLWEYDPSSNSWSQKANFGGTARYGAVGFSIGTKGYIGTGWDGSGERNDFWEYDPSTNMWSQKANFGGTAREGAVGFSIETKGYIGTGYLGTYKNDFWEYDPSSNMWSQKANFGGTARAGAVGFSIGTKGYIGTGYDNISKNDFWEYDPSSNTWSQKANFGGTARAGAVGFSIGTIGYIGTGSGVSYTYKNDFWEYDPSSNMWSQKADFGGTARYDAVGFSIGTKGYIGTGNDGSYKNDFWEYDQSTGTWSQKTNFGGTARYYAVGFSIGTKGYIGTGHDGSYKNDFWEYDQSTGTWSQKANFGGTARYIAVGFSIGTKGYIGTGSDGSGVKNDFWEYDPSANTWIQKANFGGTARYGAVGFSIGTKGYIGTGYDGTYKNDFWEYDPSNNTWAQKANFGGTARLNAIGFSLGTKGYIGTGNDGSYKNDFWEYDPSLNTWSQKANFGGTTRILAIGFCIGAKGYIGTGNDGSGYKNDFWEYDPSLNTWSQKANFGGTSRAYAVGFGIGTKGYIGTGYDAFDPRSDFWEYTTSCTVPAVPGNTTPIANQTICNGQTTNLSASGTGALGWYSAASGGTYLGGGSNYTTPVLSVNTTFYVQDSTCVASATRTSIAVTVNALPVPTITGSASICIGTTGVTYTTETSMTGYTWNVSAGGTITAGSGTNTITVTWNTAGAQSVSVNYTNGNGCTAAAPVVYNLTVIPTVGTPTAISISVGTEPTCQLTNGTTTTTYATTSTNNTSFNWSLSNGAAGSIGATTGVMTWANGFSGTVDIRVTANGCNGPSAQVIRTVVITPTVGTPTAITISAGTEPTCQLINGTTTTTYGTTSTNNTGLNWSLSNGAAGVIGATTGLITWANGFSGTVNIQVTANGCNGPSAQVIRTVVITPTVGTPTAITISAGTQPTCQLTNATTTTTYATTSTNNTGFNWSLSNGASGSIGATTGLMTWANGFSGTVNIQVTASGCNGPSTQVIRTVTITPTVGTPSAITISAGTEPSCQLTNGTTTTTYATTATNNTGFNWSLSNGLAGSIGATTGLMTWANGFSGTVNIQVTANGCNGPSTQVIRTVTVTPTVGTPTAITISAGTEPTCQLTNATTTTTYATTSTNNTSFNWSLSNGSAGSIAATTGLMTWANGFSGTVNIQVTANGCNGPSAQVIRTVVITPTVGIPTAITISAGTEPACQLTNGITTTTYATTSTNNTGFNWSLSNGSAGSIGATTGLMTWANGFSGTVNIQVTANGCNGPSAQVIRTVVITPTVGTPTAIIISAGTDPACQLTNGTITTTYATTATNNTGYNWSLSNGAAGSIGATTGLMTWANGFSGTVNIQVSANGCNGPSAQVIRTVTITPTVGMPVFVLGAISTRCQDTGTVTYSATATNNTGITYTLDAASLAAGISINGATGAVTYVSGWVGVSMITATATGCNGPSTASHLATTNPRPGPTITGPASVCIGSIGNVYTTQAGMTGYTWTVSAGGTITAGAGTNAITVTWSTAWAQTVSVNYTNGFGCPALAPTVFNVTVNTLPVPTITGPTPICMGSAGNVYTTQASMSGYTWAVSAGGTITTGAGTNAITITWNTAGAQTVSVSYTNVNGCTAAAPTVFNVTVNALPVPTISGQSNMCINSGNYNYTTESGMTNYVWNVSAGGVINFGSGTNQIQVSWIAAGAQTVSVSYTNGIGCNAATPTVFNITVNPLPNPAGTITGTANVCAGVNGVAYTVAQITGATTYVWTLPPNATIASGTGTNSITVNYGTNALSGNIFVYGNNLCGNGTSSPPFAVTVAPLPATAGNITGPASVCQGLSGAVYSVGTITNATGYNWTVPSGAAIVAGANTNSITIDFSLVAVSGNITVLGTNSCGNGTVSPNFAVAVNTIPPAPVINALGDVLTSNAPTGNQWYFEGNAIVAATGQTWTAQQSGWYWDVVTINGCGSDTSNHIYILMVGIEQQSAGSNVVLYPNPNEGVFTLMFTSPKQENYDIRVYNNLGVQIFEMKNMYVMGTTRQNIDLRPAPNGVYSLVISNDLRSVVKKIVINK